VNKRKRNEQSSKTLMNDFITKLVNELPPVDPENPFVKALEEGD